MRSFARSPVADSRSRLATARLYLCTPSRPDLAAFLDAVLPAGVDIVQFREKPAPEAVDEIARHDVVRAAAARHDRLWAVNDRADIAYAAQPDILHLGQRDLSPPVARELLGADVLLGLSTHDRHQVDAAVADGSVDYFCVGPCWATPTKPGRPAAGLELVSYAASRGTTKPWFAIGGIDLTNLIEVQSAGATRVVVVRAIRTSADAQAFATALA